MSRLSLRDLIVRLRLGRMDDIRELHRILNEEDRNVVSNNVPVALIGIELDSEASHISNSIGRATATKDGREAKEDRSCARCVGEDASRSHICGGLEECELAEGAGAACMDDTLWNAFVVEAVDLEESVSRYYH